MVSSASRRKEMSEGELRALLSAKIVNSLGYQGGKLAQERIRAEKYYLGDPFGNEVEGRSQVVSRDVAEAVDSMLPALLKIFTAGAEVARFEPMKPGEDDAASQATDYVNWIWNQKNDGFQIYYAGTAEGLFESAAKDRVDDVAIKTYQAVKLEIDGLCTKPYPVDTKQAITRLATLAVQLVPVLVPAKGGTP
jgi:hypothetical protein